MKTSFPILFFSFFFLAAGYGQKPSPADRFERLDKDGDGKLSATELPAPAFFKRLDKDGDGWVTRDEIPASQNQARRRLPEGVEAHRDLIYAEVDGQSLKLDLFLTAAAEDKPPLLVWIHGGGWTKGSKEQFNPAFLRLTGEGYATASIDYRLEGLQSHPKQIHDCKAAIRWLRAHAEKYGYDASRIAVGGGSAGGHLSVLLGVTSGVAEMEGEVGDHLDQSSEVLAIVDLFGPVTLKRIEEASPLRYLDSTDPPVIIFHGDQDKLVPPSESETLHARYQELGLESSLHVIEGAGHGGLAFSDRTRYTQVKAFLDRHLKGIESETPEPSSEKPDQANSAEHRDLAYGEHPSQKLDLYQPTGAKDAPVMIYIHGGGWRKGDKGSVGQKTSFFVNEGWVFVSANYRLIPGGEHPKNVEDVASVIAWVKKRIAEYGGSSEKIFLMGHSAGCHLVSLAATKEEPLAKHDLPLSVIKGVIANDTQAYDVERLVKETPSTLYREVFGEDPAVLRDASPQHHVGPDKGIAPFLILYSMGISPERANPKRPVYAEAFRDALREASVPAEVIDASDRTHGQINQWFGRSDDEKVTSKAKVFLNAILEKSDPPKNQ